MVKSEKDAWRRIIRLQDFSAADAEPFYSLKQVSEMVLGDDGVAKYISKEGKTRVEYKLATKETKEFVYLPLTAAEKKRLKLIRDEKEEADKDALKAARCQGDKAPNCASAVARNDLRKAKEDLAKIKSAKGDDEEAKEKVKQAWKNIENLRKRRDEGVVPREIAAATSAERDIAEAERAKADLAEGRDQGSAKDAEHLGGSVGGVTSSEGLGPLDDARRGEGTLTGENVLENSLKSRAPRSSRAFELVAASGAVESSGQQSSVRRTHGDRRGRSSGRRNDLLHEIGPNVKDAPNPMRPTIAAGITASSRLKESDDSLWDRG